MKYKYALNIFISIFPPVLAFVPIINAIEYDLSSHLPTQERNGDEMSSFLGPLCRQEIPWESRCQRSTKRQDVSLIRCKTRDEDGTKKQNIKIKWMLNHFKSLSIIIDKIKKMREMMMENVLHSYMLLSIIVIAIIISGMCPNKFHLEVITFE